MSSPVATSGAIINECVGSFVAFVMGFVLLIASIVVFHSGPCEPKPRWQDKICEPHQWHHPPSTFQIYLCLTISLAELAIGIFLAEQKKFGPAEGDSYSDTARRGACAFRNVDKGRGDSASSSWGIAHLALGFWSTFWCGIVLNNLQSLRRNARQRGPAAVFP